MISTSSYKEFKSSVFLTCSISGDKGKDVEYDGKCYSLLAPKKTFWNVWHDNIGKVSDDENNKYYIREYYNQVLSSLDPEKVYRDLDYSVLLCYESNLEFCHRHIVAAWFELLLSEKVPEINCQLKNVDRPKYIKEYLEEIMKSSKNMRGFNSLRALYLFEKGEKLEAEADELEKVTGKCYDNFRQSACYLRCEAEMAEEEYNELQRQKRLIKLIKRK